MPEHELFSMTPKEWTAWINGAKESFLDQQELNIHLAKANQVAQAKGNKLKVMQRNIDKARKSIYQENDKYKAERKAELEKRKRIREVQKQEGKAFFDQLKRKEG
ncbi:hypothetical protein [Mammaliicoccus sciuri]|uniref:hypothetical protein n=1 Tax=Mammaliicoccus sciuri TaxID=1296 RepID=UPI003F56AF43